MKRLRVVFLGTLTAVLVLGLSAAIVAGQGDTSPVPGPLASRTGVSGPIEQGDTGYWRSPYLPTGRWGVSGPVEQGDSAFWRAFHVPVGKTGISGPIEQDMFGW
jgi:hypothetical protein